MNKLSLLGLVMILFCSCGNKPQLPPEEVPSDSVATVYMTTKITPQSLIDIYKALGVEAKNRVAVKISTGEAGGKNYLKPELIGDFVHLVNGTIVECNCAYWGKRDDTQEHWQTIKDHGFLNIAKVDIMDEEGEMKLPVRDTTHIPYNIVGSHLKNYDFMVNLSHFKGHPMAGYGGAIKNQSIGVSSANGKILLHSAGKKDDANHKFKSWSSIVTATPQDAFLESMAAAAQSVADYFGSNIIYINVMNNLSIDCDCLPKAHEPKIEDVGILASTDPVALDQACLDIIFRMPESENNDPKPLQNRIQKKHGTHTVDYAAKIGLGTKQYKIISID